MKIFFPNIHRRLPKSIAKAIENKNYSLLLPDETFKNIIKYGEFSSQDSINKDKYMEGCTNIKSISYEKLLEEPPDVIIVSCYEVENDIINNIWKKINNSKVKLAYYNGNNDFYCNWDYANNIFTTDIKTAQKAKMRNKNCIIWLPWVDFDNEFLFKSVNNNNIFNSYISKYKQHFPRDFDYSQNIKKYLQNNGFDFNIHESLDFNSVSDIMNNSCGTIHIKSLEGYGYSIIESMACGRMVFLYKPYSENKTYTNWCLEDKTCFYFNDEKELLSKIKKYKNEYESYQIKCSQSIRTLIDNKRQNDRLVNFFNNLV